MSVVIPVSADWLTLRERADAESRSRALAMRAVRMLRPPLTVHDLGSGTGSMVRWLAPLLPGPQTWVLHDWNPALLEHAARARIVDADRGPITMRTRVGELEHLRAADVEGASLVTASALLDVLAADEVEAIVDACVAVGAPALFGLSVNGRVELDPLDPGDRVFEAAFNDHQRRVVEGRRLLGPDAVLVTADLFRSRGRLFRYEDELFADANWIAVMIGQNIVPDAYDPLVDAVDIDAVRANFGKLRSRFRSQRMPSGSRPLDGSSSSRILGSPSSAVASASRWRMPSENPPARSSATRSSPTSPSTSSTREAGMSLSAAVARRWLRAVRPGCVQRASRTDPTVRAGWASSP